MKYKLIKTYPGSPKLGTVVVYQNNLNQYIRKDIFSINNYKKDLVEDNPEFWEEVIDKNYEVISYMSKGNILYPKGAVVDAIMLVNLYCVDSSLFYVNSVRRLSDGEVFTLGDRVKYKDNGHVGSCNIGKFYLNDQGDCVVHGEKGYKEFSENINLIEKVIEKPLFKTEDGFDIFKGDKYYVPHINGENRELSGKCLELIAVNSKYCNVFSRFSTKEKAEDYITMNKPCLSLKDIESEINLHLQDRAKLNGLVKDKLNFKKD